MNNQEKRVGRRRRSSGSACVVEALEGRAMLAAGDEVPRRVTLSGHTEEANPATQVFHAKAGERWVFEARTSYYSSDVTLYADGEYVEYDSDYADHQAVVSYLATADVTLTVRVDKDIDEHGTSGSYSLVAETYPPGYADPGPDARARAASMPLPGTIAGAFEWDKDVDWYSVHAEAGVKYGLVLGSGDRDTAAVTVESADGTVLAASNHRGFASFVAPASGRYFVKVRSLQVKGAYSLGTFRMEAWEAEVEYLMSPAEWGARGRVFYFYASPGRRYEITVDPRGGPFELEFIEGSGNDFTVESLGDGRYTYATASGRMVFLRGRYGQEPPPGQPPYTIRQRDVGPAEVAVPRRLAFDGVEAGRQAFLVKAGERYVFRGRGAAGVTEVSLETPDGVLRDDDALDGEAGLSYLATEDTTVTVRVSSSTGGGEPVGLTVNVYPPGYQDPVPGIPGTSASHVWPGESSGLFEWHGDVDVHVFRPVFSGREYVLTLGGVHAAAADASVVDQGGTVLATTSDGVLRFTAPSAGRYDIVVRSRTDQGGYTLTLAEVGAPPEPPDEPSPESPAEPPAEPEPTPAPPAADDPATAAGATRLRPVGGARLSQVGSGSLTTARDVDAFRFAATGKRAYLVEVKDGQGAAVDVKFAWFARGKGVTVKRLGPGRYLYYSSTAREQVVGISKPGLSGAEDCRSASR